MKKITNPLWLILVISIPQAILFALFFATYKIIGSLLTAETIQLWYRLGGGLALATAGFTLYAIMQIVKKEDVSRGISVLIAIAYSAFLYFYFSHIDDVLPFSIPGWMLVRGDVQVYGFTFIMPALIYSVFLFVSWITPEEKMQQAWLNLIYAALIPAGWFFLITILFKGSSIFDNHFAESIFVIMFIGSAFAFLVFVLRFFYTLIMRRQSVSGPWESLWQVPVFIIFPVLGLYFNQKFDFIFGDFNHPIYFIIAVINGIILCLPRLNNKAYRLALFIAAACTFSYICYFFLVFLPYLPLSILAIIAIGFGFLMLTPLVIFYVQAQRLYADYNYLKNSFRPVLLIVFFVLGFLLIPVCITTSYLADRATIYNALNYIYHPDYDKLEKEDVKVNPARLMNTLDRIEKTKTNEDRFRNRRSSSYQPYLSSLYNWLVLDNLTLADAKIDLLKLIFTDGTGVELSKPSAAALNAVEIDSLSASTKYDDTAKCYRTQVVLKLKNDNSSPLEYTASINLADGFYISNYYLLMNGKKEYGILAEKRTAQWIYNSIVRYKRDPGLLYYTSSNMLGLKVFPVPAKSTSETGFEIIHQSAHISVNRSRSNYISIAEDETQRATLPMPAYHCHFLIDRSAQSTMSTEKVSAIIDSVMKNLPGSRREDAEITFVNFNHKTFPVTGDWRADYTRFKNEGGFFVDPVVRTELRKSYEDSSASVPVFFTISDKGAPFFRSDIMDVDFALPSSRWYSVSSKEGILMHSFDLADTAVVHIEQSDIATFVDHTFHHHTAKQERRSADFIQLFNQAKSMPLFERAKLVNDAYRYLVFHPEQNNRLWLPLLKEAFTINVLNPAVSFIALEDEAQKNVLKAKQEEVLNAQNYLDTGEENIQRMSEPPLWLMFILAGGLMALIYRRKISELVW